jgi:hypothetical protein
MSRHVTHRLARMGLALAVAAVTLLDVTGSALARGPFPIRAAKGDLLTTGSAFPVVVIPIAICIAIVVIVLIGRRQSRSNQGAGHGSLLVDLPGTREGVDAKAKRAA